MATAPFTVALDQWQEIHELPDAWSTGELRTVLEAAEFEDEVADADVEEMALMALQDLGVREAGELALRHVFGAGLSDGVRQNLISELEEDRPWEQFADVGKQAGIFRAVTLLHKAFPNIFGTPDAVQLCLTVRAGDAETSAWLCPTPDPGLVVRLLAGGMDEDAVLRRLYEDELAGATFAAAPHILWRMRLLGPVGEQTPASARVEVISSHQWLDPLEHASHWRCDAWPDAAG